MFKGEDVKRLEFLKVRVFKVRVRGMVFKGYCV